MAIALLCRVERNEADVWLPLLREAMPHEALVGPNPAAGADGAAEVDRRTVDRVRLRDLLGPVLQAADLRMLVGLLDRAPAPREQIPDQHDDGHDQQQPEQVVDERAAQDGEQHDHDQDE